MRTFDVAVIGAGPAGMAAGLAAHKKGAKTVIIERESRPGGILKQCIHDGFGLIKFGEKLTGPEYAGRYINMIKQEKIQLFTATYVNHIDKIGGSFILTLVNALKGVFRIQASALVLANGCRERTARQVSIHGSRPAGVYTAGTAQYFVNIMGYLPCKRCVILGSGDIGLIMARRLKLEGAEVLGVYEAKPAPSGLSRNIVQCLNDFSIPLYLSHTVTRIFGDDRVEGVEICRVDDKTEPIQGTERRLECDGLILSVGLIPENEIAESLGIKIDDATKGPYTDQNFMTLQDGVYSCGNALNVNDLVDYVSETGELAGENAAGACGAWMPRKLVRIKAEPTGFLYTVPQFIDINSPNKKATIYFRTRSEEKNARVQLIHNGESVLIKKYAVLRPPEMERLQFDLSGITLMEADTMEIKMIRG